MLWRTLTNIRRGRWDQERFWQLTRTVVDPVIPNLPLETPAGGGTTYYQSVAGSLTFTGGIAKKTLRVFSATPLPFTGGLSKKTQTSVAGSLSFSGGVSRMIGKSLSGSLVFAGNLFLRILRGVTAGLTFVGTLVAVYIPGTPAKRLGGKRKNPWSLPEEVYQWLM